MKAVVYHKPGDMQVENVDDPKIKGANDIILKVTSTAICGSDLHFYNGFFPQIKDMIMGHEFMGIVEETGPGVKKLKKGDRVVVPFPVSCGHCFFCDHQLSTHCENSNPENYGPEGGILKEKGAGLFGYSDYFGGYDGGQAEYVRVPYADFGPRKVSDSLTDNQALFLTDIFPTGWAAIDWANLKGGETVAVFGCGPVGIMAQKAAWIKGAGRVIGIDKLQYRCDMAAKSAKSEVILANNEDEVIDKIRQMTSGRGADVCIDAVGMEADRNVADKIASVIHMEAGSIKALKMAFSSVRRGGMVSVVGVYATMYDNFPLYQFFDKGLSMRAGQAPVHTYIDELTKLVENGKVKLDDIITHELPLSEASNAYAIFNEKKDNCVKVVLKP
ncbi:MAG: glutathione-dependent formaldehyde dehydrogenase [Bacteroidota bacterium]|nr:glutathione-dependent formaldehyde dehydrogenase [Bacteroidota bacterium]